MNWSPVETFLIEQAPGLILGAVLGFLGAWLLYRLQTRDKKREAARDLVSAAKPVLLALRRLKSGFDRVQETNPTDLALHFVSAGNLEASSQLDDLQAAKGNRIALPHQCAEAWLTAIHAAGKCLGNHASLKKTATLEGSEEKLAQRAVVYRRLIVEAENSLCEALQATRKSAARDTRSAIDRLLEE